MYVWQYPLRLVHWGLVISIGVCRSPATTSTTRSSWARSQHPFLMGWFRFVHEAFGMIFIALFLLRIYLFFDGNRWVGWRQFVPLQQSAVQGNVGGDEVLRLHPAHAGFENRPQRHGGVFLYRHLRAGAGRDRHRPGDVSTGCCTARFSAAWSDGFRGLISIQNLRLIHFFLMFVFIAFGIFHVHLCMLVSRAEKRGLMDSIFIGYKIIPVEELDEETKKAAPSASRRAHDRWCSAWATWFIPTMDWASTRSNSLQHDPRVPADVVLIDGGTQGLSLLPHISGFPRLLVIDAVDVGEPPGTLVRLEGKALEDLPGKASVHQLGFADLMVALKLLGESPAEIVVFGVQPLSTEWSAN